MVKLQHAECPGATVIARGWYRWTRYVCRAGDHIHLGHWWMGGIA